MPTIIRGSGSADFHTALPVAEGGTGATASTGSGNVVLSVSPTLTGTLGAALITSTTASGENKLTVKADAASQQASLSLQVQSGTPGQTVMYMGKVGATTNGQVGYNPNNDKMTFFTNNSEKMAIDSSGTVTLTTPLPVASGGTGNTGNNHVAWVHSQSGVGSTNTRIPIWGSLQEDTGAAITFASSAAAGSSFTITQAGLYEVFLGLYNGGSNIYYGASLNSNQLTTDITGINVAHRIFVTYAAANTCEACSRIIRCAVNDVIRPHHDSVSGANSALHSFCVRKIGNI
jgi:hypothetical protein